MVKRVLMIAYHYPPVQGSSGVHRTVNFVRYLPESGWEPHVLTVNPRAYESVTDEQTDPTVVTRAFGLDTARHLAVRGSYPGIFALPDRWITWWLGAVPAGLGLIRKHRPEVIWSTYPIATAHLIGLTLSKITGIPWVADFRDSMTEDNYPSDPRKRRIYQWIERHVVTNAKHVIFTAPGAVRMYAERYPDLPASKWVHLPNGYDEDAFIKAEYKKTEEKIKNKPVKLVHSGILYPSERDPHPLFDALADLRNCGEIVPGEFIVVLRGTAHDDIYRSSIASRGIEDIVSLEPPVPYVQALEEMLQADGLLLLQASNCNHQIPAKLYEYLRAQRPILALTDPLGDTAQVLSEAGAGIVAPLNSKEKIVKALREFLLTVHGEEIFVADQELVSRYSRRSQTAVLARILEQSVSTSDG